MARSEGRIRSVIWTDEDFLALDAQAQRLYLFLLSQPDLSHAGLVPLRVRRWAKKVGGGTPDAITAALEQLVTARFVLVDEDTEEVLVRTFVRNDGVYRQPKVMLRLREDAREIESPVLRAAFAAEIDRWPLHELSDEPGGPNRDRPSTRAQVQDVVDTLRVDFADPSGTLPDTLPDTPAVGDAEPTRVRAGAFPHPPTPIPQPQRPSSSDADAPDAGEVFSDDVHRLCDLLADLVRANGHNVGAVGVVWWRACDRLMRLDGFTAEQVEWVMRWATSDEFWQANIRSMPKLREKFTELKSRALADHRKKATGQRPSRVQQNAEVVRRFAAMDGLTTASQLGAS